MIGREMFSFAEKKGDNINFVVLYGYEFLSKGYKIFVSEKQDVDRTFRNLQTLLREKGLLSKTVSFDTNLDYIDLRFGEKVYIKKK
jgi:hypothetical protein